MDTYKYISSDIFRIQELVDKNDLYHCEDGPAVIWNDGMIEYYIHGIRHRENGPAIRHSNGRVVYRLNGKIIPAEDIERWINENNISIPFNSEQQIEFIMKWG